VSARSGRPCLRSRKGKNFPLRAVVLNPLLDGVGFGAELRDGLPPLFRKVFREGSVYFGHRGLGFEVKTVFELGPYAGEKA